MPQLRILVIDDNPGDRALIVRVLKQEFPQAEIQEILERTGLNRALKTKNFDVVVTDFQIRWITGLDVLFAVKQADPHIPVIMFTNTGTEEIAVEAMKLGLDDYILKEAKRYVFLPSAVQRALERAKNQKRAELLTEEKFQALTQQLNSIQETSFRMLSTNSQISEADYHNNLYQIQESAKSATQIVQELFRYHQLEQAESEIYEHN